jgi:hypothetical protein
VGEEGGVGQFELRRAVDKEGAANSLFTQDHFLLLMTVIAA